MNISTLLRLVVPASESEENETAAKPATERAAPAQETAAPEARSAASPAVPAQERGRRATRSAPAPALAPPQPKTDGSYQFGAHRKSIEEKLSSSLEATREFPSLTALEAKYPHVMGQIRAAWGDPRKFDLLMRDLLLPSRPGRSGFDPEAALELTRLQEYDAAAVAPLPSRR